MRRRRWLSAVGVLLVTVGSTTFVGTAPALGRPNASVVAAANAPTGFSAEPGDGIFTLTFNPPGDGSGIIGYQYSTDDGDSWQPLHDDRVISRESSDDDVPLGYNIPYRLRVRAFDADGPGTPSDMVEATIPPVAGAPAAPTALTAGPAGDNAFPVTFTAPAQGDSAIIKYQYTSDGGHTWRDTMTTGDDQVQAALGADSADGTPFGPGKIYRLRVRAMNTQGAGLPSNYVDVSLSAKAPGAPHYLSVAARPQGGFTLSFGAVPADGGQLVWEYTTDNRAHWLTLTEVTGDKQLSAVALHQSAGDGTSPFEGGAPYEFRVRARNNAGEGPYTEAVTAMLPAAGTPAAPGEVSAVPTAAGFGVSFTAPSPGDSAILKYQYSTDDGNSWSDTTVTGTGPLHVDIRGDRFYPGHLYRIRIRAANTQGPGWPSSAAEAALLPTAPGAPFDLHAEPGDQTITVNWGSSDNGSQITGYEYSTDGGSTWQALSPVTYDDRKFARATIGNASTGDGQTRLQNGQSYQVQLRGTNSIGTGPGSKSTPVTLPMPGSPGRPTKLAGSSSGETIGVDFTAPEQGTSAILKYEYSTDDGVTWAGIATEGSGSLHVTITAVSSNGPLNRDDKYGVRLRAVNAHGAGLPSARIDVSLPPAKPGQPFDISVAPGNRRATVTLSVQENGSEITKLEYSTDDGATWQEISDITPVGEKSGRVTITHVSSGDGTGQLVNGVTYQLRLRVSNDLGAGPAGDAISLTPATVPGAPATLTATPANASGKLVFALPVTGGSAITGWEYSIDGGTTWAKLDGTGGKATITKLVNDTTYQVRVRALNVIGAGAASPSVTLTPLAPPVAPTGVTATARTSAITVSWTASASGGAAVTGYTAIASPGPATCETTTATTCVLGAEADKAYTITVVAHSAGGDSPASVASSSVTATAPVIPSTPPVTNEVLTKPAGGGNTTPPGSALTISGSGYAPNSEVALVVYSSPISLGTVLTDANGAFSVEVVVPPTLSGDHSIAAMGADPQGNPRAMKLEVVAAAPTTTSPTTASPTTAPTTPVPATPTPTTSMPAPAKPAAPTGVTVAARTSAISVSWTASASEGVTGYTAIASPGPATCETTTATTCVLGAEAGKAYTVTVVAHMANGDSPASAASSSATATAPVIPSTPPTTGDVLTTPGGDGMTSPGSTLQISGTGFAPHSDVALVVYSSPVPLGTARADAQGEFSVDVVVPAGLTGDHTVAALGTDPDGNPRAMRLDITVAEDAPATPEPSSPASPARPALPTTGAAATPTAVLGVLMLLIGAALASAGRRRRHRMRRQARN